MFKNLLKVQNDLKAPKGQRNTFGNYNYRSCEDILEAVKPLLLANGLCQIISDKAICIDGWHYIESTVTVYKVEGSGVLSCTGIARESETKKGMDSAQITGAASSYARKYALNGMYAIDDTKDVDAGKPEEEINLVRKSTVDNSLVDNRLKSIKSIAELTKYKEELKFNNEYTKIVQDKFTKKAKELK